MSAPVSAGVITLRNIRGGRMTDGTHVYWRDGARIRWALIEWSDDGVGSRTHGAASDLLWAIEDAWSEKFKRDEYHVHEQSSRADRASPSGRGDGHALE